jgi:hypothetical protein
LAKLCFTGRSLSFAGGTNFIHATLFRSTSALSVFEVANRKTFSLFKFPSQISPSRLFVKRISHMVERSREIAQFDIRGVLFKMYEMVNTQKTHKTVPCLSRLKVQSSPQIKCLKNY